MLLDPILPEQGLGMLYSYRGIGKTFFALGIGLAVACGGQFLCWRAPRPRRVLYVDGELPARTLQDRCNLILMGVLAAGGDAPQERFQIVTPDLQDRPMPDLSTWEGQSLLEPLVVGVDLVLLDNLSALCRNGSENEGEDWLPVQQWALDLRRRGTAVLFVHHAGKNKSQRGTSRREDLLDTVITLKHPADYDPSEGLRCEVHFEKTRAMLGESARPFEVQLKIDPQDEPIWTVREIEDGRFRQASELFASGLSVRKVAKALGVGKSTAGRYHQKLVADCGEVGQGLSHRPSS